MTRCTHKRALLLLLPPHPRKASSSRKTIGNSSRYIIFSLIHSSSLYTYISTYSRACACVLIERCWARALFLVLFRLSFGPFLLPSTHPLDIRFPLQILLWKNWLILRRRRLSTLVRFIAPFIFVFFLWVVQSVTVSDGEFPHAQSFFFRITKTNLTCSRVAFGSLYYVSYRKRRVISRLMISF